MIFLFFLFNDTATTEIYTYGHTLSLHYALPIFRKTLVLRLPITEGSAKVRGGDAVDEPEDVALPIWAGSVPLRLVAGAPAANADLAAELDADRKSTRMNSSH